MPPDLRVRYTMGQLGQLLGWSTRQARRWAKRNKLYRQDPAGGWGYVTLASVKRIDHELWESVLNALDIGKAA